MKLFEFAILFHPKPTASEQERGVKPKSEVLVPVKSILANNEKEASVIAAREIPTSHEDRLDCIEIALRPF